MNYSIEIRINNRDMFDAMGGINSYIDDFNRWGNQQYDGFGDAILLYMNRATTNIKNNIIYSTINVEVINEDEEEEGFIQEDVYDRLLNLLRGISEDDMPMTEPLNIYKQRTTSTSSRKRKPKRITKTTHKYSVKYQRHREYTEEHLSELVMNLKENMEDDEWDELQSNYRERLQEADNDGNLEHMIKLVVDDIYDNYNEYLD